MPPAIEKKPTAAIPPAAATVVYVVLGWSGVENNLSCLRLYPFYLVTVVIEKNQSMPYLRQRLRWSTWCWDGPVLRIGSRGVSIWWRLPRLRQQSRVLAACGSLCFFCPALTTRSRQPVKRLKNQMIERLGSFYEYAGRNPLRVPKGFPMDATHALLEEEFKKFGPIKHNGIQVRNNRFCCE
ncbi:hypothetical protein R6Q59_012199 [Mikania micrantha]